jgi:formylglycine-generating enzyme required for sulfatase activity
MTAGNENKDRRQKMNRKLFIWLALALSALIISGCEAAQPTTAPLSGGSVEMPDTSQPTQAPTITAPPQITVEPTQATPQPSEIISLDETWNQYINYQLGFSIKFPKTMVSFLGSCKWNKEGGDHSYRPDPAFVPVKIFEDAGSAYITAEYYHKLAGETTDVSGGRHFFAECNQVTNSLALLQDPNKPHEMWKFVGQDVQDDAELDAFIKTHYGAGCSLGEKTPSAQEGVYDVSILGDGKDLEETTCPLNFWHIVKYAPSAHKVIAWNPGQAYTFAAALDYSVVHDHDMVESFHFLNVTATALPVDSTQPSDTATAPPLDTAEPSGIEAGSIQTRPSDGMDMVYVPAGEFLMGSDDDDVNQAIELCTRYGAFGGECTSEHFQFERPAHPVALDGFWMDRTEVSNAQFQKCVDAGVCDAPPPPMSRDGQALEAGPDQAAVYIFWEQAQTYCQWAGGRLPTEAEWEYAARGPQGYQFPWGDEFDGSRLNYCDARCGETWGDESMYGKSWADVSVDDGYAYVAPVGSYPGGASWCGALDLAGNVAEWVSDTPAPYTTERQVNPNISSGNSEFEIARGGSWQYFPNFVRSANRFRSRAQGAASDIGFRCVVPGAGQ